MVIIGTQWDIPPGEQIERKVLQERYGGRTQGGIGPSKKSPNVLIFSDPASGEQHGYFDGWRADGGFHYTGEGQRGDQRMMSGNAAILNHIAEGRALRVFMGARGIVTYEDEFELDSDEPWYTMDAPESGNTGRIRSVIVFRLRPKTITPPPAKSKLDAATGERIAEVPIEEIWSEKTFVNPSGDTYEAERREQVLVKHLEQILKAKRHDICRLKIVPDGEAKPIFCDLLDRTSNVLVEAKGSVQRGAVRMAIGQLSDYKRFVSPPPRLAVLLPALPRKDLIDLLDGQGIGIIYPTTGGFADTLGDGLIGE